MKPSISIIIPVYNTERFLDECFRSVEQQTFSNWECLLVNDGSSDSSGQICDDWAQKDNRFRVFHKQNGGQSSARNLALDKAQGDYIMFLDSDDTFGNPNLMQELINLMENDHELDVIQFSIKACFESGQLSFARQPEHDSYFNGRQETLCAFSDHKLSTIVTEKIFRKNVIPEYIRFPEGRYYEDECFLIDILQQVDKAMISKVGHYYYRLREGSTTHQNFNLRHTIDLFKKDFHGMKIARKYPFLDKLYWEYFRGAFKEYKNAQILGDNEVLTEYKEEFRSCFPSYASIINNNYGLSATERVLMFLVKFTGFGILNRLLQLRK